MNKVVIVGCGNVGMSYAYALLNQKNSVNELVLIDLDKNRIEGEVMDLNHCLSFAPSKIDIKAGDYSDCSDAKIVVIAAGANQEVGETRMDLINKNSKIFKSIVDNVMNSGFTGVFLVATNPVDVMSYLTYKYSNLPSNKVIGTGTTLDTSRLRYVIADKLGINPKNVHAYVVGEHGDSEFVLWSSAIIGTQNINDFLTLEDKNNIHLKVKNAAYEIIERKGATYYGVGMCLVKITDAILNDKNCVLTVSVYNKQHDVYIGLPVVIGTNGVEKNMHVKLDGEELVSMQKSINVIKDAINKV